MATGRNYKNVYTILEKVKKGEINSHYKTNDGLFGRINFYKKPDLVKPYLHYIDEKRVDNIVKTHLSDNKVVQKYYDKFRNTAGCKKLDEDKKPDLSTFYQKFQENYEKFPESMSKDIFKMFYNKIEKLDFEERDEKNYTKFKFLEKANNPVGKIMTEQSNLKSALFTRSIIGYFIARMTMMDYVEPEKSENIKNNLNGNGSDFNNSDIDDMLQDMMGGKSNENMLNDAMNEAQDLCKQIDKAMDSDIQEQMFENSDKRGSESSAGKLSPDYLKQIAANLESINLSMGSLKDKIKKLLDKSKSYFSANKITKFEDLFNTDNVAGLEDYELLHPKLRKIFAEDLQVKDTINVGKIDLYVDISGSMDSSCGVNNSEGRRITKIDFCKAFAAKLKSMDMLNDLYLFNTRVHKKKNDIVSISMIAADGGTIIDEAVRSIEKNGINALVITDAEDRCKTYSDKTFFIGVEGARFNHFSKEILKEYSDKGQMVVFNGDKIYKVDEIGNVVL